MPNSDEYSAPRPPSRAERLMAAAKIEITDAEAPLVAKSSARAPKPGARARALNKRIRDVLKEQTNAVYSEPGAESAEMEAAPKASSSWEDLADEIAPAGIVTRRGLTTGAARGGSRPNPESPKSPLIWREKPIVPTAILGPSPAPSVLVHEALCGEEKFCETNGPHYLISETARAYDATFADLHERTQAVLDREVFPALSGARAEDLLFVDIETTGLSSSQPLFLIGALALEKEPRLDLFLARDYPEERAALAAFHELAQGKTIVTFNGKSFDWPYIEGRSTLYRLPFSPPRAHLDMLHHARRTWKHSLPNCKLQTLELYLCGRTRADDVPGSQIPRAYHEFVATHARTGCGAHPMAPILHHNALDILTLAELLCKAGEEL